MKKPDLEDVQDNACPYCDDFEGEDLMWSNVLDAFVHVGCVMERLAEFPEDRQAVAVSEELGLDELKY